MAFLTTMDITGSALTAERFRINIISQNLTNMETTRTKSGEPYRRKQVVFQERALTFSGAAWRSPKSWRARRILSPSMTPLIRTRTRTAM